METGIGVCDYTDEMLDSSDVCSEFRIVFTPDILNGDGVEFAGGREITLAEDLIRLRSQLDLSAEGLFSPEEFLPDLLMGTRYPAEMLLDGNVVAVHTEFFDSKTEDSGPSFRIFLERFYPNVTEGLARRFVIG